MTRKESVPAPQPPTPIVPSNASGRKFGMSPFSPGTDTSQGPTSTVSSSEPVPSEGQMSDYRYINVETLAMSLKDVGKCGTCGSSLTLKEDIPVTRGLVTRLSIQCKNPECPIISYVSDPYNEEARVLNTLFVLGIRMVGRGSSGLKTFCAIINTPSTVSPPCYSEHNQRILDASMTEAEGSQRAAASYLHERQGCPNHQVTVIVVKCDGTWSKRDFTALYGVVVVTSWESGKVLTKYRPECSRHESMQKDSEKYKSWWAGHQDSCDVNYHGFSLAVEATGALKIWQQYVQKHNLRYMVIISDGDTKTLSTSTSTSHMEFWRS